MRGRSAGNDGEGLAMRFTSLIATTTNKLRPSHLCSCTAVGCQAAMLSTIATPTKTMLTIKTAIAQCSDRESRL